ncbi:tripartite motif-containing protein 66-like [Mercenaria mercenaria]|uniref:tripartite motif-containing protein 66-like n=1 Tax=Mercenaria mercenaria TaxID=6596 RepID=UPI00234EB5E0|nr:tripartite motif-containing protein 66-like [Mercenaria mercenaria]
MTDHKSKYICEQGSQEYIERTCEACEDDGKYTAASGWCRECEENMCSVCFGHHRKGKICRDHVLLDFSEKVANRSSSSEEGLVKCKQHSNEIIKFYCPTHDQVGCADCIILEHKVCKIEYIHGSAIKFNSFCEDLENNLEEINRFSTQVTGCLTDIRNKRTKARDEFSRVKSEIETFRDDIIKQVNKLTDELCTRVDDLQSKKIADIDILEQEAYEVENELMSMKHKLESCKEHTSQLFIATKQIKQTLKDIRNQMDCINDRNSPEQYIFQRNATVESILEDDCVLGCMQKARTNEYRAEAKALEKDIDAKTSSGEKSESLERRSLRIDNLEVNGEYLSFTDSRKYTLKLTNGLFIGDLGMDKGSYFEIEIVKSGGSRGSIGIGLVPADYPKHNFPGWRKGSIGYHSDDGRLFIQSFTGKHFGPACCEGDKMGCGISLTDPSSVFFTRNSMKIGDVPFTYSNRVFPAVALDTFGQKVKVTLEAK